MKTKKQKENPWQYIDNAKQTLKTKAIKHGEFYTYPKYVKTAGHQAWTGVLLALDELMKYKGIVIKGRKDIDDYRNFVAKQNKKILDYLNSAYNYLHLLMGYDGDLDTNTAKRGLELAEHIIHWVEKQLPENYFHQKN
ncbi:MAG: hypothetical protein D6799_05410 [Bacteroidetes bacterium]|jgi:hypothetical protein|nr:MAG: hypothetical protein D6799_05410 [Bacteroidota bacterium]